MPGCPGSSQRSQDNFYFGLTESDCVLTCWIALDDANAENGCMRYIDGSHSEGIVEHVCTDPANPFNLDAPLDWVTDKAGGEQMPKERLAEVKRIYSSSFG